MIGVSQVCLMVLLVALVHSPLFLYFIVPCWKSWLLYLGKAQQWPAQCYSFLLLCAVLSWVQTVASAVLLIPTAVCSIVMGPDSGKRSATHSYCCVQYCHGSRQWQAQCYSLSWVLTGKRSATHSYCCVQYCHGSRQWQAQCYSFLLLCAVLSWVQTVAWLPVFGVKVHTDVDVYDCRCGCTNILRESVLEVDCGPSGRKIPCHTVSVLHVAFQSGDLPAELFLTQQSSVYLFTTTFIDLDHYFKFTAVPDMVCSYLIMIKLCMIVIVNDIICIMIHIIYIMHVFIFIFIHVHNM